MFDLEEWLKKIKEELINLFLGTVNLSLSLAQEAAEEFLQETKEDLKRWWEQLKNNEISGKDLEWLIKARLDVAKLTLLKQAGLTAVAWDKMKVQILNIILSSIT